MNNQIDTLKKQLETLKEEIKIYEQFINHNNLEEQLENFIDVMDQLNKDNNGLYWYEYRLRGFSIGCQPKGHKEVNHNLGKWGIIAYDRQLTENEIYEYDLSPYNLK